MSNLVLPPALGARVVSREPYTDVRIDASASGKEARSSWWLAPRTRYKVAFEVLRQDLGSRADFQQIASLFSRHFGQLDSFLFTDEADSAVTDHGFAVGDGSTTSFQLQRSLLGSVYDVLGGPWPVSSKPRTNNCLQSQSFDSGSWSKLSSGVGVTPIVVANAADAPDGTPTADLVILNNAGTTAGDYSLLTQAVASRLPGTTYTLSIWLRTSDGSSKTVWFADTGAGGSQTAITVTPVWQRFTVTEAPTGVNVVFALWLRGATGSTTGTAAIYAWGAQIELGAVATQYIATTSAAVTANPAYWPTPSDGFEPVFDPAPGVTLYKDGDGLGRRALASWPRTNLCLRSQTLNDGASWGGVAASIGADATPAPDGTTTAESLTDTAVTAQHYVTQNVSGLTIGSMYVASAFMKAGTLGYGYVQLGTSYAAFDLATGVIDYAPGGTSYSSAYAGGGWWRIAVLRTAAAVTESLVIGVKQSSGAGVFNYLGTGKTAYAWGAQVEAGTTGTPGDYIPTTAAAVARTDYTPGSNGAVTLAVAPASGAVLSWTGSHYKRVRLDSPGLQFERLASGMYAATVDLVSVKP